VRDDLIAHLEALRSESPNPAETAARAAAAGPAGATAEAASHRQASGQVIRVCQVAGSGSALGSVR
jgi:hypothetical protein